MSTTGEPAAALPAVTAAAEPSLREHALRRLPADRFAGRFEPGSTRGFVVEAIHEGWLLHYGTPRAFARTIDDDLRLLGGDAMFALGLDRLAEEGDLAAVAELALGREHGAARGRRRGRRLDARGCTRRLRQVGARRPPVIPRGAVRSGPEALSLGP